MSVMRVSWGPQHPASGQFRLVLDIDGDTIVRGHPDIGYTHRGIEKLAEIKNYWQIVPLVERVADIDSFNMALGHCHAVEELMGVEVPERAKFIRVVMGEISRIMCHLYWIALFHAGAGLFTAFMWPIADRELFCDLAELATGSRVTFYYIIPGGVRRDVPTEFYKRAIKSVDYFERRLHDYEDMFYRSGVYGVRSKGVAVLRRRDAIRLGAAGNVLRGSGVRADVRKDEPYDAYDQMDFEVITRKEGDCHARARIWLHEMWESCSIIKQAVKALQKLPRGPIRVRVPLKVPEPGETYSRIESARGELGYYIKSTGGPRPYRFKMSTPSFRNAIVLEHLLKGAKVADVPVITFSTYLFPLDADR